MQRGDGPSNASDETKEGLPVLASHLGAAVNRATVGLSMLCGQENISESSLQSFLKLGPRSTVVVDFGF